MTPESAKHKIRRKNLHENQLIGPVAEIADLHREIVGHLEKAVQKAMRIGELLTVQKAAIEHGQFVQWIEQNCPFSLRTAQRYMRIHRQGGLSVKNDTVSLLPHDDSEDIKEICRKIEAIQNEELPPLDTATTSRDEFVARARMMVDRGRRALELRRKLLACQLPSGMTVGEAVGMDEESL